MSKLPIAQAVLTAAIVLVTSGASAQDKAANRYPFDPACPWGRLANGKGMVLRCLTQAEAAQLSAAKASASAAAPAKLSAPVGTVAVAPTSANTPASAAAPTSASAPVNAATPAAAPTSASGVASADVTKKPGNETKPEALEADVVNVTADEGSLDGAKKKLRAPRDKYVHCVSDNGGLTAEVGEVTLRFLVRERGRAEGTEVEKRQGVSEGAARCIAAVVDRRPVGTPEGPAVGVKAVIRVVKSSKR